MGIGVDTDNTVMITIGSASNGNIWYWDHFTAQYSGDQPHSSSGFSWSFIQGANPTTANTNNVFIDDAAGTITTTGSVGIGTTSLGNILTIQQSSATDPIADAWAVYSSRRWKNNITNISNSLEKIQLLRGVYFNWNSTKKHDLGMIAVRSRKSNPGSSLLRRKRN